MEQGSSRNRHGGVKGILEDADNYLSEGMGTSRTGVSGRRLGDSPKTAKQQADQHRDSTERRGRIRIGDDNKCSPAGGRPTPTGKKENRHTPRVAEASPCDRCWRTLLQHAAACTEWRRLSTSVTS